MTGALHNWDESLLWMTICALEGPEVEEVKATLVNTLPRIQAILAQGNTSPEDFTLHDSQHGFRVAQRMVEIVPKDVLPRLSIYELALLLLSAYLHDIGMCPPRRTLNGLLKFALTGRSELLSPEEASAFQDWLDASGWSAQRTPVAHWRDLERANLAVAHYVRSRHVAWGEAWSDANLQGFRLGTYAQAVDDLKLLCSSHHFDYPGLLSGALDAKPVSATGAVVHPRYLSIVLRVADVVEIDPERTPEVIFRHRGVSPGSIIFWHKDHQISTLISDTRLTLSAEPRDARIHRAVELTVRDIESELEVARRVNDERPFRSSSFQDEPLPHRWDLQGHARVLIRPRGDAYEYIDGAFRPNTEKLLQLLSGENLYQDPLVAFREVLQNAFDAVREQIAYERLQKRDPQNEKWDEVFGETHEIELSLEQDTEGNWFFVCIDDGVGMNKTVIRDYLLVSGNTLNPRLRRLERDCAQVGVPFFRSGQFGIGVLSYFLVADLAVITTRRSPLAGDGESHGWRFESEGIGAFGELRKDESIGRGTAVRMRLRTDVIEAILEKDRLDQDESGTGAKAVRSLPAVVSSYIRQIALHAPCRVVLPADEGERHQLRRGWTRESPDVCSMDQIISQLRTGVPRDSALLSEARKARLSEELEYRTKIADRVVAASRWNIVEGDLANGFGRFRAHVLIFANDDALGPLLHEAGGPQLDNSPRWEFLGCAHAVDFSWKGIRVNVEDAWGFENREQVKFFSLEIDIRQADAGTLAVDRRSVVVTALMELAVQEVVDRVSKLVGELIQVDGPSPYSALLLDAEALTVLDRGDRPSGVDLWLTTCGDPRSAGQWKKVEFPVLRLDSSRHELVDGSHAGVLGGKKVTLLVAPANVYICRPDGATSGSVYWPWYRFPCDRVVGVRRRPGGPCGVAGLYSRRPFEEGAFLWGSLAHFPREWSDVAGARVQRRFLWNREHALVGRALRDGEAVTEALGLEMEAADRYSVTSILKRKLFADGERHRDVLAGQASLAASWLAVAVAYLEHDEWIGLMERSAQLLRDMWGVSMAPSPIRVILAVEGVRAPSFSFVVREITQSSCETIGNVAEAAARLQAPASDSVLELVPIGV